MLGERAAARISEVLAPRGVKQVIAQGKPWGKAQERKADTDVAEEVKRQVAAQMNEQMKIMAQAFQEKLEITLKAQRQVEQEAQGKWLALQFAEAIKAQGERMKKEAEEAAKASHEELRKMMAQGIRDGIAAAISAGAGTLNGARSQVPDPAGEGAGEDDLDTTVEFMDEEEEDAAKGDGGKIKGRKRAATRTLNDGEAMRYAKATMEGMKFAMSGADPWKTAEQRAIFQEGLVAFAKTKQVRVDDEQGEDERKEEAAAGSIDAGKKDD